MTPPDGYEPWVCGICTASCTFEAMQWCHLRDVQECGYDTDEPLALDGNGVPKKDGIFEFVTLRKDDG